MPSPTLNQRGTECIVAANKGLAEAMEACGQADRDQAANEANIVSLEQQLQAAHTPWTQEQIITGTA